MRNKALRIIGKRGIVRRVQFCNGPLQNWNLNTDLSCKAFRILEMARCEAA
jgi:hypothetical protein